MATRDIERALRLLEQLEGYHKFEEDLIDPDDWDQFDCGQLLRIADGETTIEKIVWGQDDGPRDETKERERLAAWNAAAQGA